MEIVFLPELKRVHFKLSRAVTRNDIPGRGMPFRDTDLHQFEMLPFQNHFAAAMDEKKAQK